MIAGAAIIPGAPLLLPEVAPEVGEDVASVRRHVQAALGGLRQPEALLLVAAVTGGGAVYGDARVDLAGIGRPDVTADLSLCQPALGRITAVNQYPLLRSEPLPLPLAVLGLHLRRAWPQAPVLPIAVPAQADYDALVGVGAGLARSLDGLDMSAAVVAAGDLSAGLTERSPRPSIPGARDWDEQAVAVVDSGRLDGLRKLGPTEAQRVVATGWAAMAVLHGACARAKVGMVVRHYSAPRGVGYLVAAGG